MNFTFDSIWQFIITNWQFIISTSTGLLVALAAILLQVIISRKQYRKGITMKLIANFRLHNFQIVILKIWNSGDTSININDYNGQPITVELSMTGPLYNWGVGSEEPGWILNLGILNRTPKNLVTKVTLFRSNREIGRTKPRDTIKASDGFNIEPTLLNTGDGLKIALKTIPPPSSSSLDASVQAYSRITGLNKIKIICGFRVIDGILTIIYTLLITILTLLLLYVFWIPLTTLFPLNSKANLLILIILLIFLVEWLLIWCTTGFRRFILDKDALIIYFWLKYRNLLDFLVHLRYSSPKSIPPPYPPLLEDFHEIDDYLREDMYR